MRQYQTVALVVLGFIIAGLAIFLVIGLLEGDETDLEPQPTDAPATSSSS